MPGMSDIEANKALIERFWGDMAKRDFTAVRDYFTAESHYTDVPANEVGATGPDAIEARLRLGIEPLEDYKPKLGTMTAEDDRVIVEHSEEWFWNTGEHVELPFVSVFDVRNGKIVRWWDYWDMGTLMNAAPQWWVEHIMQGYQ
jgi:limonene-1,2-epoxide hydrolase